MSEQEQRQQPPDKKLNQRLDLVLQKLRKRLNLKPQAPKEPEFPNANKEEAPRDEIVTQAMELFRLLDQTKLVHPEAVYVTGEEVVLSNIARQKGVLIRYDVNVDMKALKRVYTQYIWLAVFQTDKGTRVFRPSSYKKFEQGDNFVFHIETDDFYVREEIHPEIMDTPIKVENFSNMIGQIQYDGERTSKVEVISFGQTASQPATAETAGNREPAPMTV